MIKGFENFKMGLLGEKLGHSFSPLIHQKLADYEYKLYEVAKENLAEFITAKNFDGLNVTIPYKKDVLAFLDEIDPKAEAIGAINTIKNENGKLIGYNTDYDGFLYLLHKNGIDVCGKKAIVLGNGGAAAPVREVLKNEGASEIVTISRKVENNYENIAQHYDAEVIVNTTPVGMYPHNGESLLDLKYFTKAEAVVDIIYNPLRTRLVLEALELDITAVGGLDMLVGQAVRACEIWTGESIPLEVWDKTAAWLYKKQQNVVLIGMPGSGKSTQAKLLAEKLCRKCVEIDDLFKPAFGRTPAEIIPIEGEARFRELEHELVTEVGKKSGIVISTGGGVVTRAENYFPLKQNGIIIALERDITGLATEGRPISQSKDLSELFKERKPLYDKFSDFKIMLAGEKAASLKMLLDVLGE
ncbi:MAG: shikimate kinase [Clostridiales bacterium]|nr:MAG: shikimate kinase [Clostridiales bacterium]